MIYLKSARHVKDHLVSIEFSDGASGVIDLRDVVSKYEAAAELRDPAKFAQFQLDEWPTLAWPCGFDLAPEYLYELLTGSPPAWSEHARDRVPMVAEDGGRWPQ
ncbi:MAG: hypothetical protein RIR25_1190 [Verrucomicrobiota bacterium]|jgi:hypothetical protein